MVWMLQLREEAEYGPFGLEEIGYCYRMVIDRYYLPDRCTCLEPGADIDSQLLGFLSIFLASNYEESKILLCKHSQIVFGTCVDVIRRNFILWASFVLQFGASFWGR